MAAVGGCCYGLSISILNGPCSTVAWPVDMPVAASSLNSMGAPQGVRKRALEDRGGRRGKYSREARLQTLPDGRGSCWRVVGVVLA